MSYEGLSKFLVRATLREIARMEKDDSGAGYMRIAENVRTWVESGRISSNQAQLIYDALDWKEDIPEYEPEHTDEGLTLQDVSDAVADLSLVVSEIIDPESEGE